MTLSLPPSSGLALHLAAWEPNGNQGAGLVSGSFMPTWKNRGSGVADAVQASTAHQPQWKAARNRWPAVQFDSVSDRFDLPSSDSTLKFIHETGIFDVFIAIRGAVNKYGVVMGSAFNGGELGFVIERSHITAGAPLTFYLFLGAAGYRVISTDGYLTPPLGVFEPGRANKMLFRATGVGSYLRASADFSTFVGGAGGAVLPALPTGNATNALQVGAITSAYFFGGEILDVAIYNRNLSAGELTTMSTYFLERYGV